MTTTVPLTVGTATTATTTAPTRPETAVERAQREAEEAFAPKPHGRCGRNMWNFYCCDGLASCCDVDHLAMHLFFIGFVGGFSFLIAGFGQLSEAVTQITIETYFLGMGFAIGIAVVGYWQINQTLAGRLKAAELMDINGKLAVERGNLDNNIKAAISVKDKLSATHDKTQETTELLRQKFNEIKTITDQSKIISDQSSKLGILLKDKYEKLIADLEAELIASEKGVIEAIYDGLHLNDGEAGLDETEFGEFVNKLPNVYKKRFKFEVGAFNEYAGTDGILSRQELDTFLNQFIQDEINAANNNNGNNGNNGNNQDGQQNVNVNGNDVIEETVN